MNYKRLYIENSLIFITIVTFNRIPILLQYFDLLKKSFQNVLDYYCFDLIAYSIQKDHLHCIIKPLNYNEYPKIVKSFKYAFTKNVGLVNPTYKRLWQNRYWEHTITNEKDLYRHLDYIHYNPVKHHSVDKVKDWQYSSFHNFVKEGLYEEEWCNFGDKNKILELNYE